MKTKLLLFLLLFCAIISGCTKKKDSPLTDNILYTDINKSVSYHQKDSISGTCKDLVFEIINNGLTGYSAILSQNDVVWLCDGFNSILLDSLNGQVSVLNENEVISNEGYWGYVNDLKLDNFAGKGPKYIGYRPGFYPSGVTHYQYGWIKVELTPNRDTLRVISTAINNTSDKSIIAGQLK
jgi:hypothetical protein